MLPATLLLDLLALTGGTVHTLVPGEAPLPATLLVRDERIEALLTGDAALELPEGARVVPVDGLHIVPGLVDALVDYDPEHAVLYVSAGITLVRDLGNDPARVLTEKARPRPGPAPALQTGGVVLDGERRDSTESHVVKTPEEAAHVIEELLPYADFVSIRPGLTEPVWRKVSELAHGQGLEVWGPAPRGVDREVLAGVQDGLFYLDALLPPSVDWSFVQPGAFVKTAAALAAAETCVVPLLGSSAFRLRSPESSGGATVLRRLSPHYEAWWISELKDREQIITTQGKEEYISRGMTVMRKQLALVKQLHDAGVQLVPGSGAPHPWLAPGGALHDELALWVLDAKIPAADVLALATRRAAEALGDDQRGTLAPGKLADVLVVDGDPRTDLRMLRKPVAVVLRGRLLERAELDRLVEEEAVRQDGLRRELSVPLPVAAPTLPDEGELLLTGALETRARGLRVSAERWAVVQFLDGRRAYCGRMLTPGVGGTPDADLEIRQVTRDGKLEEFEVTLHQGELELVARGLWTADALRVERRLNGEFKGNDTVRRRPAALDLGSVTSLLVIGADGPAGAIPVLTLGAELAPVPSEWQRPTAEEIKKSGAPAGFAIVKTPSGILAWSVDDAGAVTAWESSIAGYQAIALPPGSRPETKPPGDGSAPAAEAGTAEASSTEDGR